MQKTEVLAQILRISSSDYDRREDKDTAPDGGRSTSDQVPARRGPSRKAKANAKKTTGKVAK